MAPGTVAMCAHTVTVPREHWLHRCSNSGGFSEIYQEAATLGRDYVNICMKACDAIGDRCRGIQISSSRCTAIGEKLIATDQFAASVATGRTDTQNKHPGIWWHDDGGAEGDCYIASGNGYKGYTCYKKGAVAGEPLPLFFLLQFEACGPRPPISPSSTVPLVAWDWLFDFERGESGYD